MSNNRTQLSCSSISKSWVLWVSVTLSGIIVLIFVLEDVNCTPDLLLCQSEYTPKSWQPNVLFYPSPLTSRSTVIDVCSIYCTIMLLGSCATNVPKDSLIVQYGHKHKKKKWMMYLSVHTSYSVFNCLDGSNCTIKTRCARYCWWKIRRYIIVKHTYLPPLKSMSFTRNMPHIPRCSGWLHHAVYVCGTVGQPHAHCP